MYNIFIKAQLRGTSGISLNPILFNSKIFNLPKILSLLLGKCTLPVKHFRGFPAHFGCPEITLGSLRLLTRHSVQTFVSTRLIGYQVSEEQHHIGFRHHVLEQSSDRGRGRILVSRFFNAIATLHVRHAPYQTPEHQHQH